MIPCVVNHGLCYMITILGVRPIRLDHLADYVRWTGVLVAVAGAFEAAPAGTARIWALGRRYVSCVRAWPARIAARLGGEPAAVQAVTATVSVTMKKARLSATGSVWDPAAADRERIETLHQRDLLQEQRIGDVERQGRDQVGGVRSELRREADDLRAASNAIAARIGDMENRSARTDARGIAVVVVGIVLTGVPDGLARFAPVGWLAIVAAVATASAVGIWVIRAERAGYRTSVTL